MNSSKDSLHSSAGIDLGIEEPEEVSPDNVGVDVGTVDTVSKSVSPTVS